MENQIICKYCNVFFISTNSIIKNKKKRNGIGPVFCSTKCHDDYRRKEIIVNCKECDKQILKKLNEITNSKSGNVFCNQSCSAKYNNTHKKIGTRRSKLEGWIEENLKIKYNFKIIFNSKEEINSELDIYIPHLKLAFELNGIFHYEPIFGDKKLESVKNNDERKFQACLEKGIEFCIIDTSGSKSFKPERDKKYLNIIENIINIRRGLSEKSDLS